MSSIAVVSFTVCLAKSRITREVNAASATAAAMSPIRSAEKLTAQAVITSNRVRNRN